VFYVVLFSMRIGWFTDVPPVTLYKEGRFISIRMYLLLYSVGIKLEINWFLE
jgi:hypothetical protein